MIIREILGIAAMIAVLTAMFYPVESDASCRSSTIKHKFDKVNGFQHGRKGYVVDHICALDQGGIDDVTNMQYQSIADSHAKDRIERTPEGKAKFCTPENSTPNRQVFNCKGSKE